MEPPISATIRVMPQMKLQIEIDKASLEWLTVLIRNARGRAERELNNHFLFDSYPHITAWDDALVQATSNQATMTTLAQAVAQIEPTITVKTKKPATKPGPKGKKSPKKPKPTKEEQAAAVYTCSHHSNYHGLRSPRTLDCGECWELYGIRNGVEKAKYARQRLERKPTQ